MNEPSLTDAHARTTSLPEPYAGWVRDLGTLLSGESNLIANAANSAAFLFQSVPRVSWVGFYFTDEQAAGESPQLVLGPFNGKPACVRIAWGSGVCGTAVSERATQRVADVNAFPGHIACDPDSRSEVVVPLITAAGEVIGVLDIDSAEPDRFDATDQRFWEEAAATFMTASDLTPARR